MYQTEHNNNRFTVGRFIQWWPNTPLKGCHFITIPHVSKVLPLTHCSIVLLWLIIDQEMLLTYSMYSIDIEMWDHDDHKYGFQLTCCFFVCWFNRQSRVLGLLIPFRNAAFLCMKLEIDIYSSICFYSVIQKASSRLLPEVGVPAFVPHSTGTVMHSHCQLFHRTGGVKTLTARGRTQSM